MSTAALEVHVLTIHHGEAVSVVGCAKCGDGSPDATPREIEVMIGNAVRRLKMPRAV
jgi:hypothetical protein